MSTLAITRGASNIGKMLSRAGQKQLKNVANFANKPVSQMSLLGIGGTALAGNQLGEYIGSHLQPLLAEHSDSFVQPLLDKIMGNPTLVKAFEHPTYEQMYAHNVTENLKAARGFAESASKDLGNLREGVRALLDAKKLPALPKEIVESSIRAPLREAAQRALTSSGLEKQMYTDSLRLANIAAQNRGMSLTEDALRIIPGVDIGMEANRLIRGLSILRGVTDPGVISKVEQAYRPTLQEILGSASSKGEKLINYLQEASTPSSFIKEKIAPAIHDASNIFDRKINALDTDLVSRSNALTSIAKQEGATVESIAKALKANRSDTLEALQKQVDSSIAEAQKLRAARLGGAEAQGIMDRLINKHVANYRGHSKGLFEYGGLNRHPYIEIPKGSETLGGRALGGATDIAAQQATNAAIEKAIQKQLAKVVAKETAEAGTKSVAKSLGKAIAWPMGFVDASYSAANQGATLERLQELGTNNTSYLGDIYRNLSAKGGAVDSMYAKRLKSLADLKRALNL